MRYAPSLSSVDINKCNERDKNVGTGGGGAVRGGGWGGEEKME
jgi:hypothetical protein